MDQPILSLLFPLYRSRRFYENLVCQLKQLTGSGYEIIISDRHCLDDTIDLLEEKFGIDKRFSFFRAKDEINWIDHYNALLQEAHGKYFCWIPHDDEYDENYFPVLVKKLEEDDASVLAFAKMHMQGGNDDWDIDYSLFKQLSTSPLSHRHYLELLNSNLLGIPFRGVFRRSVIAKNNLFIKKTKNANAYEDMFWIFGLLLHGSFIYTEDTWSVKNFTEGSAHSGWSKKMLSRKNPAIVNLLYQYINHCPLISLDKIKLFCGVLVPGKMRKLINQ